MFGLTGFWVYLLIFVGKLIEVSVSTMRIMFSGKGKKLCASMFGLAEIFLWVVITSTVITDLGKDPFKAVVYCVAFACGITLGIALEQKMAVGLTSIQILSGEKEGEKIGLKLRESGFGVTILDGHSVDGSKRELVFVQLKRRRVMEAMSIAKSVNPEAVISVSDISSFHGGFIK